MQKEPCEADVPVREDVQKQTPMEEIKRGQGHGECLSGCACHFASVVREGLAEKMTSGQRPEGEESTVLADD